MSGTARSTHHLSLDLARAHDVITRLTRELAEERALTGRLRAVIALADLASPAIKRYMPRPRRTRRDDRTHA